MPSAACRVSAALQYADANKQELFGCFNTFDIQSAAVCYKVTKSTKSELIKVIFKY